MLILAKISVTIFDESLMEEVAIEELEFAIKFETPFKQEVIDEVEAVAAVEEEDVETASETESITETKEDDTSVKPSFAGVSTETKTVKVRQ